MIFIITRKDDVHADIVAKKLKDIGADFFRFNTDCAHEYTTTLNLSSAYVINNATGKSLNLSKVRSVWLRRRSFPENIQVDKQFEYFIEEEWKNFYNNMWTYMSTAFWISRPSTIEEARSKLKQLRLAKDTGFYVPETVFTNSIKEAAALQKTYTRCIYKPHDGGTLGIGSDKTIYTNLIDDTLLKEPGTEERLKICPGIFQPYIEKAYELRVTIVGKKVFAAKIDSQKSEKTKIDWRRYDFRNVPHYPYQLPLDEEYKCIKIVEKLGLQFGAIDLIATPDNEYYFLEINANGQWAWIEALTKQPISSEIANLLVYHTNTEL